jgi:hypothetical protein
LRAADELAAWQPNLSATASPSPISVAKAPVKFRHGWYQPRILAADSKERQALGLIGEVWSGVEKQNPSRAVLDDTRGDDAARRPEGVMLPG